MHTGEGGVACYVQMVLLYFSGSMIYARYAMQPRLTTTSLSGMYVADVTQTVGFYNASVGVVFFPCSDVVPTAAKSVFFFSL